MKKIAVFPGSFDPFTKGHASIVRRGLELFDEVVVGIGHNLRKPTLFSIEDRKNAIEKCFEGDERVRVAVYTDLTVDFASRERASFILRGVRSMKDYEYEKDMADINRQLTGVETVLLFAEPELACVSSSVVRELISFGKDVSILLP